MDLSRRLEDEEEPSGKQYQFLAAETQVADGEQLLFQGDDPTDCEEKDEPHCARSKEAHAASAVLHLRWKFRCEDRDEDDVVDAENDLERQQCGKCRPCGGVREPVHVTRR